MSMGDQDAKLFADYLCIADNYVERILSSHCELTQNDIDFENIRFKMNNEIQIIQNMEKFIFGCTYEINHKSKLISLKSYKLSDNIIELLFKTPELPLICILRKDKFFHITQEDHILNF